MGIKLSGGFKLMSEGEHILKIVSASYNAEFGKIKIVMENAAGEKHSETYSLFDKAGMPNDISNWRFSQLVKFAFGDPDMEELDNIEDLLGLFLKGVIIHDTYEGKGGTKKTTRQDRDYEWETPTPEEIAEFVKASGEVVKPQSKKIDLGGLL